MLTTVDMTEHDGQVCGDEQVWYDLYTWLLPIVEIWVRDAHVAAWTGQQHEMAEDIAHEAIIRTFQYNQRSQRGEMPPIGSLKALCRVIARNYFRDWRKKDWCLVHPERSASGGYDLQMLVYDAVDPSQIAIDHLLLDALIVPVAQVLAKFPQGQKVALLTDLANVSDFDGPPSLLEKALSDVGLHLSDYKKPRSDDPSERGRYAALRCIAYKRLKQAVQI